MSNWNTPYAGPNEQTPFEFRPSGNQSYNAAPNWTGYSPYSSFNAPLGASTGGHNSYVPASYGHMNNTGASHTTASSYMFYPNNYSGASYRDPNLQTLPSTLSANSEEFYPRQRPLNFYPLHSGNNAVGSSSFQQSHSHRPNSHSTNRSASRNNHRADAQGIEFNRPRISTTNTENYSENHAASRSEGRNEVMQPQDSRNNFYSPNRNGNLSTKIFTRGGRDNSYTSRKNKPISYANQDYANFKETGGNEVKNNATGSPHRNHFRLTRNNGVGENGSNDDDENQRERLIEQLSRGSLECLVCCDRIRQVDSVWSCSKCYHVLHLKCAKKWAFSSKAENGWCCPACRNVVPNVPFEYRCFCGKLSNPEWNRQDVAHTCGEVCGKSRRKPDCTHRCTLLCHPGPCPPCFVQVSRKCGCGKMSRVISCGGDTLLCEKTCDKLLNCGVHKCAKKCHVGDCEPCDYKITQACYCGKNQREMLCDENTSGCEVFSCDEVCDKYLDCKNHRCELKCHPGPCSECLLSPEKVKDCPCGKMKLSKEQERTSCLDTIPTCGKVCQKKLHCGPVGNSHSCKEVCHNGACPPCPLTTFVRCRCGNMDREIPCVELTSRADDARCEKKCSKKRSCGKHRCNQPCCIDLDHECPLLCNHSLSCGKHRCEEPCHKGRCKPCWLTGFDELYCECGASVQYPPIPCGTKPPACTKPCTREHPCEHTPLHTCHSDPTCPPCTILTQKYCHGKHELRKTIPCYQVDFSCGRPCNSELPCGRHRCILPCHKGPCLREDQTCVQPCTTPRTLCGHNCAAPCHEGECPETPCKETVKVTCECGHRSTNRVCNDHVKDYQRLAASQLALKMTEMQLGDSVDIDDLVGNTRKINFKILECNEECKLIERNRRLAIGLQIRNPDLSAKLTPRYSDFMRQWAKKDPRFCGMIHEKLTELVQLAKQSKQKSRSFSFDPMNRDKRHFVHEYCEHFGCESVAYDQEPKRNIVATAIKEKSWLPSMSLLEVIQRESGQRKIPKPVMTTATTALPSMQRAMDVLPIKYSQAQVTRPAAPAPAAEQPITTPAASEKEQEIDYFDFTM